MRTRPLSPYLLWVAMCAAPAVFLWRAVVLHGSGSAAIIPAVLLVGLVSLGLAVLVPLPHLPYRGWEAKTARVNALGALVVVLALGAAVAAVVVLRGALSTHSVPGYAGGLGLLLVLGWLVYELSFGWRVAWLEAHGVGVGEDEFVLPEDLDTGATSDEKDGER